MMFARPVSLVRPRLRCDDPSLASQADLKDTLIGTILKRYNATGVLPQSNFGRPMLAGDEMPADFTEGCNNFTEQKGVENVETVVESDSNRKQDPEDSSCGEAGSAEKNGAPGGSEESGATQD